MLRCLQPLMPFYVSPSWRSAFPNNTPWQSKKRSARSPRSAADTTASTKPNILYGHVSKKVVRSRHTRADNDSTIATAAVIAAATSSTPFGSKKNEAQSSGAESLHLSARPETRGQPCETSSCVLTPKTRRRLPDGLPIGGAALDVRQARRRWKRRNLANACPDG